MKIGTNSLLLRSLPAALLALMVILAGASYGWALSAEMARLDDEDAVTQPSPTPMTSRAFHLSQRRCVVGVGDCGSSIF